MVAQLNNHLRPYILILLALVLTACAKEAPEEARADIAVVAAESSLSSLEQGLAMIERDGIEAHLKYLADDARMGRMTGTPEYDEAAAYVAGHFEEIGLEPGGDDGWYQQVPMLARRIDVDSAKFVFHQDGVEKAQRWKEDSLWVATQFARKRKSRPKSCLLVSASTHPT